MNAFIWAVLAACVWGIVPIMEKIGLLKVDPFVGLFYRSLGVLVGLLFLTLFMVKPQQVKAVELKTVLILVASGFLASFVAQIMFYHGLKAGDVSRIVPVVGAYPLIAFILGIFVLGEALTVAKLVGVLLVVAGVWMLR